MDLISELVELIRLASTDLPAEVEARLRTAERAEQPDSAADMALKMILNNISLARAKGIPICQDTGTPIFRVAYPAGVNFDEIKSRIRTAVAEATRREYLRPNAVDALNGRNSGDNLGDDYFPVIHGKPSPDQTLKIELLLKGGGCENVGAQYSLPDFRLEAGRDLSGVYKAALDAVMNAQGRGCAPGVLGIAIGGDRATSYQASKEVLLRSLDDIHPQPDLAELEERITRDCNQSGIGPMGFGGRTTLLGTKIVSLYRLPASYFVSVSYMCWAYRRRSLIIEGGKAAFI